MATTTKMAIPYPASTDLVKDGATDMQDLAEEVDTKTGLVFIKAQTVGTAVGSVTVTNAFNTNFKHYRIMYTGGSSSVQTDIYFRLGASLTGFYCTGIWQGWGAGAVNTTGLSNSNVWVVGVIDPAGNLVDMTVRNPFTTLRTTFSGTFSSAAATRIGGMMNGMHNVTASYTDFTFYPAAGTITGGTIQVWGFNG